MDANEALLDYLAVAEDALTAPQLAVLLRHQGHRLSTLQVAAMAAQLEHVELQEVQERLGLRQPHAERRVRSLLETGRYFELVDQVAAVEPLEKAAYRNPYADHGYRYGTRLGTFRRELRRGLLTADEALVRAMPTQAWSYVWRWFTNPFEVERLRSLKVGWAQFIVNHLSRVSHHSVQPLPGLLAFAEELLEARPSALFGRTVATERLLAGVELGALADTLQGTEPAGLHALLSGDPKRAATHFAEAMKGIRGVHGNQALPEGVCGAFLVLAYQAAGTKTRAKQALRLCALAADQQHPLFAGWPALAALDQGRPVPSEPPTHPVAVLQHALALRWADREIDGPTVEAAAVKADACGWSWLASELRAVGAGEHRGLVKLREQQPLWERQLEGILAELGGAAKATTPKKRVAWFLGSKSSGEQLVLEAREQAHSSRGWSVGRPVSNPRLTGQSGKLPALTDADRAIVGGLRSSTSRSYRYYDPQWTWVPETTWPALIGHPAVFDAETGEPLTIVEGRPRLVVERKGDRIVVRISPRARGDVHVERVGTSGYEVTLLSARHRKIGELVGAGLSLPKSQKSALTKLLDAADGLFETRAEAREEQGATEVALTLTPAGPGLQAKAVARPLGEDGPMLVPGEGSAVVLGHRGATAVRVRRDLQAEARQLQGLQAHLAAFTSYDEATWLAEDPDAALELLACVRELEVEVLWPQGQTFKIVSGTRPLSLAVKTLAEWFQVDGSLALDDGRVLTLQALLEALQDSPGRFVRLDDGAFLELTHRLRAQLDRLDRVARRRKKQVEVHALASEDLAELIESVDGQVDKGFLAHREKLRSLPAAVPLPSGLQATLRPYQVEAFVWLARLAAIPAGAILADDMGLGKTVTALTLLLHRRAEGPALVIAPTSLEGNWAREADRFTTGLRVRRLREHDRASLLAGLGAGDVVIASYGLMLSEADALAEVSWATILFDESQALKNRDTQRHKAAQRLKAPMRVALTGTPVENHLGELHAQLSLLVPGLLPPEKAFRASFQRPIEQGDAAVARQLRQLVRPFLLRRTKGEVLADLPERTDVELLVDLGPDQAALYEALRQQALEELAGDDVSPMQVLARLTRLRQAACAPRLIDPKLPNESAKLVAFGHLLDRLREGGHRALVFSQFVAHLTLVREWLDARGVRYRYLDGSTPSAQRDVEVDAFQRGEADLFLISLRAGGSGLNLTAADYVIHLDPWWNPAVEDQASDRAHRIGQTRPVTVYRLVARGTVEEQILDLHRSKRELADQLLEGADGAGRLSSSELLSLIRTSTAPS